MTLLPLHDPDALAEAARVGAPDADLRALLAVAARLRALARAPTPTARGAHLFRATLADCVPGAPLVSATGLGGSARAALARCLGEAVETLAQAPRPGDVVAEAPLSAPPVGARLSAAELRAAAGRGLDPRAPLGWVRAAHLPDGAPCLLPAALALRGPPIAGAPPLSLGCAAGRDAAAATRAAALELFERAALAAGREAALDLETAEVAAAALARLRGGAAGPRARLRDIGAPGGPPAIRAASALGVGTAAGATRADAARAALREMIAAESAAFRPPPWPASPQASPGVAPPESATLDAAIAALAARGFPLRVVTLSRAELGVPVVKIVCFGLSWRPGAA
ncbi:YcaO-like family protein [Rubrimonas sp.]|uniref:YcaO-like family protein n=1 Tax=Rubrimonas sp. TaxID=2036015 RepID=UPI002FDE84F7